MDPLPILVVGDAPNLNSGLARIARDLTGLLYQYSEELGIRVAQLCYRHSSNHDRWPWPTYVLLDEGCWGQDDVKRTWWRFAGEKPGIIFTVWDPARCSGIMQEAQALPVRLWGYFAVDGTNAAGAFGGPAAEVVRRYDRVLAYGRWGAGVLSEVKGDGKAVQYLPHGLDLGVWKPQRGEVNYVQTDPEHGKINSTVEDWLPKEYVSCVATNQPRKDLGLLFETWALMREEKKELKYWLHADEEVRHWSVPELAQVYGLNGPMLTVTTEMTDQGLAEMYSRSLVTMLPTLGEGFGYPIVESLACGVPCISTDDHAGGAELVPRDDWRVGAQTWRTEGTYAIRRPVVGPRVFARKALWAIDEVRRDEGLMRAYCQGSVAHLDWQQLAPRWLSWVRKGIGEIKG